MDRPRSWRRSELGHAFARDPIRGPGQITRGAQLGRLRLSEGRPGVLEGPVGDLATEHARHVERLSEEHVVEREPVSVEPLTDAPEAPCGPVSIVLASSHSSSALKVSPFIDMRPSSETRIRKPILVPAEVRPRYAFMRAAEADEQTITTETRTSEMRSNLRIEPP